MGNDVDLKSVNNDLFCKCIFIGTVGEEKSSILS